MHCSFLLCFCYTCNESQISSIIPLEVEVIAGGEVVCEFMSEGGELRNARVVDERSGYVCRWGRGEEKGEAVREW
jgi:hypothetical protein